MKSRKPTPERRKSKPTRRRAKPEPSNRLKDTVFYTAVGLLFVVPLAFSTAVQAIYSLPKFVLLSVGAAILLLLLTRHGFGERDVFATLKSRHVKLVCLYFAVVTLSAAFGVAPRVSWFGTTSNFMGWLTQVSFLVCFFGLVVGIGTSERRFHLTLWVMAACGGMVSLYAVAQSVRVEPFVPTSIYTFASSAGSVIRVCSSLGHSNYLGNFLLYTTPVSASLAATTSGKARWLALLVTALSVTAILASGVRGAWVGILVGAVVFAALEGRNALASGGLTDKRRLLRVAAGAFATLLLAACVLAFSAAGRSVAERVESLWREGASSSGRLLLWRDSLKMVPAYALTGCGPEGFRKALLAYKSKELAQLSPTQNNESSHNAYLDNTISHGLAGGALYVAIIVSALLLFRRARRRSPPTPGRVILSGVIAAFAAALTHQIFIFHQLSTGLYFFAFLALAAAATSVFDDKVTAEPLTTTAKETLDVSSTTGTDSNGIRKWFAHTLTAAAGILLLLAVWYAVGLVESEVAFTRLFAPGVANNFQSLARQGERVTQSPMPTGAYHFLYARALDTYAKTLASQSAAPGMPNIAESRQQALQAAIQHTELSLAHTNTPDLNYSLLGSLALAIGDTEKLSAAAAEAVRQDPNNYYTRWLLAEAHLARGDKEAAAREAEIALEINPKSPQAAFALTRARGEDAAADPYTEAEVITARQRNLERKRNAEQLIQAARALSQTGKLEKAKAKLLTALVSLDGNCADCQRELALVYEKMGRHGKAISAWEAFLSQTAEPNAAEQVRARIETLRQKGAQKP